MSLENNNIMKYFGTLCLLTITTCFTSCKDDDTTPINTISPVVTPIENTNGNLIFTKNFGGLKNESGEAIVTTQNGGYAVLGYTQSSDQDIIDKTDDSFDLWLLNFNSDDELIWSKTYGSTSDDRGSDLVSTSDGGFVITGYTSGANGDVSVNNGNQDFWIAKLNSSGTIIWEKSFGYNGSDRPYSIIHTQDNGFLISGVLDVTASAGQGNSKQSTSSLHAGGDYWAIKLDNSGNQEWTKYFGGNLSDDPYGIAETDAGNFILVGASDSIDVDITNNKGSYDYWVISISSTGTLLWEENYGGSEIDEARGITKTSDGNFIIIGNSRSDDQDISTNNGGSDIWLTKITDDGTLLWEKNLGGTSFDIGYSIKKSNSGFIISGASRSQNIDLTQNYGQNDALLAQIDTNGNINWIKTAGGTNEDLAYDAVQLDNGEIIVVGETTSNDIDFTNNKGFTDLLLLKIK